MSVTRWPNTGQFVQVTFRHTRQSRSRIHTKTEDMSSSLDVIQRFYTQHWYILFGTNLCLYGLIANIFEYHKPSANAQIYHKLYSVEIELKIEVIRKIDWHLKFKSVPNVLNGRPAAVVFDTIRINYYINWILVVWHSTNIVFKILTLIHFYLKVSLLCTQLPIYNNMTYLFGYQKLSIISTQTFV